KRSCAAMVNGPRHRRRSMKSLLDEREVLASCGKRRTAKEQSQRRRPQNQKSGSQRPTENSECQKNEKRGDADRAEDAARSEERKARFGVAAQRDDYQRDGQPG